MVRRVGTPRPSSAAQEAAGGLLRLTYCPLFQIKSQPAHGPSQIYASYIAHYPRVVSIHCMRNTILDQLFTIVFEITSKNRK